jgi:hypothetical protein
VIKRLLHEFFTVLDEIHAALTVGKDETWSGMDGMDAKKRRTKSWCHLKERHYCYSNECARRWFALSIDSQERGSISGAQRNNEVQETQKDNPCSCDKFPSRRVLRVRFILAVNKPEIERQMGRNFVPRGTVFRQGRGQSPWSFMVWDLGGIAAQNGI